MRGSLPVRIGIDQAAPARAVERLPLSLGLCEAIGDRIDHGRMMAHAAMAALDLDALGDRGGFLLATLPGADAVGAAEDRRGWHWRRFRQRPAETVVLLGAAAAGHLIDAPGVGGLRMTGEGTAKRDHRAHPAGHHLGELPRIEAAKAPADQADLAVIAVAEFVHEPDHPLLHAGTQTEVAALPPARNRVSLVLQETAQRPG